ncbi:MAG: S1 RNA-binding domain-containing protein [Planctomycetaceae bacterium]
MSTDQPLPNTESPVPPAPAETSPPDVTPAAEATPVADAPMPEATPAPTAASADTSATEAPATEAPATEAPATEAPATETSPTPETPSAAAEETKPRLRLNPTFIPSTAKAVPTLAPSAPLYDAAAVAGGESPNAPAQGGPSSGPAVEAAAPSEPPPPPRPIGPPVPIPPGDALEVTLEAEIADAMKAGPSGAIEADVDEPSTDPSAPVTAPPPPKTIDELKEGDRLTGVVASISGDNVFLDFGLPKTGIVSLRQCNPTKPPQVGDRLKVIFQKIDETEGLIHVNVPRGRTKVSGDWTGVAVGQSVEGMVTKSNKGGLEVTVGSLRAFLPASQVELGFVADLDTYIGQKLAVLVTEVNPARRRMVVSRKQLLIAERSVAEKEVMATLAVGEERTGVVKTLKDYGAFIDIGGVDAFLHIGQISWTRINHPSEVLTVGQSVEVKVLTIDDEKKRISLGMRQLSRNPWADAENQYPKDSRATGKVTRIETFGAFVELEPGVEGLVHISELDHKRVKKVEEVLKLGQTVEVQIVEVDPKKKRISLSLKALTPAPEPPKDEDSAPGQGVVYERQHKGPLKGGIGGTGAGGLFGDPGKFK